MAAAPPTFRLKNGRVPAWMSTKPGGVPDVPAMPANLVPIADAEHGDEGLKAQEAEELRQHMEAIRSRLKLEKEFEGIDPFAIKDDDIETAMELGVLPLPVHPPSPLLPFLPFMSSIPFGRQSACFKVKGLMRGPESFTMIIN